MKNANVHVTADKIKRREDIFKWAKRAAMGILLLFTAIYIVFVLIYQGASFSITISDTLYDEWGIVMYERKDDFDFRRRLQADELEYMDNISINWLPADIATRADGPHNGYNFIAYSFYVENRGENTVTYWKEIFIDSVTRNVDEIIRIMIFQNDEPRDIYAKKNARTGEAEPNTIPFHSDDIAVIRPRKDFFPGSIDRYTIVIWIEGDDPDTTNDKIGGLMKMHMKITHESSSR